jgi:anti-sigma regulatory factor (Ser/Thr protein kinase)
VSTVLLPHAASSVAQARRTVAEDLTRRRVPTDLIEDTVLVLSEVLSNALKHARPLPSGKVRVRWSVTVSPGGGPARVGPPAPAPAVELQVTDGGSATRPRVSPVSMSATGGRGLGIVSGLADDWGVIEEGASTTVWVLLTPRAGRPRSRD